MNFNFATLLAKDYDARYADTLPWSSADYNKYLENLVRGGIVVMGRNTFETLPPTMHMTSGHITIVLSNNYVVYKHLDNDRLIFTDVYGLQRVASANPEKQVWVVGGNTAYKTLIGQCANIYATVLGGGPLGGILRGGGIPRSGGILRGGIHGLADGGGIHGLADESIHRAGESIHRADESIRQPDLFSNFELVGYSGQTWSEEQNCAHRLLQYSPISDLGRIGHELQHLDLMRDILENGSARDDRTGVGVLSVFGRHLKYDVSKHLPILTTKFVPIQVIIKELLWFIRGETDAKILQRQGVRIWDGNSSREFLKKRKLNYAEGDIGPGYGHQWRHFGAEYKGCSHNYDGQGFDQIEYIINELKTNPFSRRIYMSAWNPSALNQMALPPCHVGCQFYAEKGADGLMYLSLQFYQRSQDVFLAANFNLVSYTILLYIVCKKVGMRPKDVIHVIGDAHVYKNHVEQSKLQMSRAPLPQPILYVSDRVAAKSWADISVDDFTLIGYLHHPAIRAEMAI